MTHSFLLEIGLEEMPAHVVTPAMEQLKQRVINFLDANNLKHGTVEPFATPRRLAVLVHELANQQPDQDLEVKGPAKKIAVDEQNHWTKAAEGFARGQGVSVQDIFFQSVKGTDYVYIKKHIAGQQAADILPGIKDVITTMTFPTRMRWNKYKLEYIRPIHWVVALLDHEVINFQLLNIHTSNQTWGHRFLGSQITLAQATDYQQALADDFVIADPQERQHLIEEQLQSLAQQHHWQIEIDPELLEEVTNLVEYPTAFAGHFDPKYLQIPEEVLITSMKDNQRYFYVRDQDDKLAPYFIGVRNGNQQHLDQVIAGNEKVLVARLEDAAFFFQEDQKHDINYYVHQLKNVTFHDKIGSMTEKMACTKTIALLLAQKFNLTAEEQQNLQRAADIYKFDLVTDMVGEFAELQGVMGEKYALKFGETPAVAQAIREHYLPTSAEGVLPQSTVGQVLALANKLDSIMSFFAVDLIPNGSNDPYSLRRQATGIVRILEKKHWHLDFNQLQPQIIAAWQQTGTQKQLDYHKHVSEVNEFLTERVRQLLLQSQVAHDLIATVTTTTIIDPVAMLQHAQVLQAHQADSQFKEDIEALTRVLRITAKAALPITQVAVNPKLFETASEQQLYQEVQQLAADFAQRDNDQQLKGLLALQPTITKYFDDNMINAADDQIRYNRLRQLQQLAQMIQVFGDLTQLIVK